MVTTKVGARTGATTAGISAPAILRLTNVGFGLPQRTILAGVELELFAGDRVAVVGQSGTGKSTLLRLILGEVSPTSGAIELLGRPVRATSFSDRAAQVGVLFQEDGLLQQLDAVQNLLLCEGRWDVESEARATSTLEAVGILGRAQRVPVAALSGGQRRRVALARVLLTRRVLRILDEPTTGVDPATTMTITRVLTGDLDWSASAALIVTHDLEFARQTCTRQLVLEDGRLSAIGEPGLPASHHQPSVSSAGSAASPDRLPVQSEVSGERVEPYTGLDVLYEEIRRFLGAAAPLLVGSSFVIGFTILVQALDTLRVPFDRFFDVESTVLRALVQGLLLQVLPLTTGLLFAGVGGASIAGRVATMRMRGEIDTLRWGGKRPVTFLAVPTAVAAGLVLTLILVLSWGSAVAGSAAAIQVSRMRTGPAAAWQVFHDMWQLDAGAFVAAWFKVFLFSQAVAVSGYVCGARLPRGSTAVASRAALAVVVASAAVVVLNALLALIL